MLNMKSVYRLIYCLYAVVFCALIFCISASESSAASLNNRPNIEFETLKHDFGDLFQNEEQTFSFRFKNIGDRPLKIISAEGT
jgi:thermostable 8-oxoguanine DNA glycosylase